MPRGKGKVLIEVSRELRDRIRKLSEKYGLTYEELLWRALDAYTMRGGSRAIPVHKTITTGGEVAYAITIDGEIITLTHRELRILCRSGLIDIILCSKTILA
jgi:hypothetical protein